MMCGGISFFCCHDGDDDPHHESWYNSINCISFDSIHGWLVSKVGTTDQIIMAQDKNSLFF